MTAFLDPKYARTAPNPEPLRWAPTRDVRALAEYIRACLVTIRTAQLNPNQRTPR